MKIHKSIILHYRYCKICACYETSVIQQQYKNPPRPYAKDL